MNAKRMVTLSNIIAAVSIALLVYWVFVFALIQVFDLKVFMQNMTKGFYLSILGILSLMFGALMINIMFNLTRIAEKHNDDSHTPASKKRGKIFWASAILSFPVIALFLFFGNHLTTLQKKEFMMRDVTEITTSYQNELNTLMDYQFSEKWRADTYKFLRLLGHGNELSLIVMDKTDNPGAYLEFTDYRFSIKDPQKSDFYFRGSSEEKKYLKDVFENHHEEPLFSAYRGNYKLFFPYRHNDKTVVLFLDQRLMYGKFAS